MNSLNPDQREKILDAVNKGDKITAIKLVREYTGWGLAEAKNYVEKIPPNGMMPALPDAKTETEHAGLNPSQKEQILSLLGRNNKIEAIKLYRTFTDAGLAEAKHAVEEMQEENLRGRSEHSASIYDKGKGCFALLLLGSFGAFGAFGAVLKFFLS